MINTNEKQLLNKTEVARMLSISPNTLDACIKRQSVPEPIMLGERTYRWNRVVIERFIETGVVDGNQ